MQKKNIIIIALFLAAAVYCICYWMLREHDNYEAASRELLSDMAEEIQTIYEEETSNAVPENEFLPIRITAGNAAVNEEIKLYVGEGNLCYVFLPAYADLSRLQWCFEDETYKVDFDGKTISNGDMLQKIDLGLTYDLCFAQNGEGALSFRLKFMQSENLPVVFIKTQSETMDYVEQRKGNAEAGEFTCVLADGNVDSRSTMNYIKGRGNTSWGGYDSKNQYNMELSENTDILDMGSAQRWVLQGNRLDASMLRNKLVYDFAKDIGLEYAVDAQYVDMYFNGEYAGLYLICEKIEVGDNRVECQDGYLFEHDFRESDDSICFTTAYSKCVIQYPVNFTEEEKNYISDYAVKAAESIQNAAISSEYEEYIDVESFAKIYIINEIVNNPDANYLSTYYYKKDNSNESKLCAGPAWDFDLALGNEQRAEDIMCSNFGEGLYTQLYQSAEFRESVEEIFLESVEEAGERYCTEYFVLMKEYIRAAYAMNEARWKDKEGYSAEMYSGFDESIGYLEYYFTKRFQDYKNVIHEPERYHKVSFIRDGKCYAHIYIEDGQTIPETTLQWLERIYSRGRWYLNELGDIDVSTYQVFGDIELRSHGLSDDGESVTAADGSEGLNESSSYNLKGELAMQWISFIMLMIPGLIALWISGNMKVINRGKIVSIIMQYFVNTFIILLLAYGIFYITYGSAVLSFSDIYDQNYDYSIYNINVAFKYLVLASVLAIGLGIVERLYSIIKNKAAVRQRKQVG